jgi:hypothetical protein
MLFWDCGCGSGAVDQTSGDSGEGCGYRVLMYVSPTARSGLESNVDPVSMRASAFATTELGGHTLEQLGESLIRLPTLV